MTTDLFGNEAREPGLRPQPKPTTLDLFEHCVERVSLALGKSPTQVRCELLAPGSTWSQRLEHEDRLAALWAEMDLG